MDNGGNFRNNGVDLFGDGKNLRAGFGDLVIGIGEILNPSRNTELKILYT